MSSMGRQRTLVDFWRMSGIDIKGKKVKANCNIKGYVEGWNS